MPKTEEVYYAFSYFVGFIKMHWVLVKPLPLALGDNLKAGKYGLAGLYILAHCAHGQWIKSGHIFVESLEQNASVNN